MKTQKLADVEKTLPEDLQQFMKEYHNSKDLREKHFKEKDKFIKDADKKIYGVFNETFPPSSGDVDVTGMQLIERYNCSDIEAYHDGIRKDIIIQYNEPTGVAYVSPTEKVITNQVRISKTSKGHFHARPEPTPEQTKKVLRKDEKRIDLF